MTAGLGGQVWNVNVESGSGDVTRRVPPALAAEVDIETSSGEIETGSGGIKLVKGQ